MPTTPDASGLMQRLRLFFADAIELLQVRLELLTVEARLEAARLAWMLLWAALGLLMLSFGLIFLSIFVAVLFWDTHRETVLAALTVLYLGAGVGLLVLARAQFRRGRRMFAATRSELQRDKERLQA